MCELLEGTGPRRMVRWTDWLELGLMLMRLRSGRDQSVETQVPMAR